MQIDFTKKIWIDGEISHIQLILTRRCYLKCSYCRVISNYSDIVRPAFEEEKDLEYWKDQLSVLKGKDVFLTVLGGEVLILPWFEDLIEYLNSLNDGFWYGIITTGIGMTEKRFKRLVEIPLRNWSFSWDFTGDKHIQAKTNQGYRWALRFKEVLKDNIDVMALTVLKDEIDVNRFEETIKEFSDKGIWFELSLLDFPKNEYYDFAEISPFKPMKKENLIEIMEKAIELKQKGYLIHNNLEWLELNIRMADESLEGNLICPNPIPLLSVDSDGKVRLCNRIRGRETTRYELKDVFERWDEVVKAVKSDWVNLCEGCNLDCVFMYWTAPDRKAEIFKH